MNSIFGKDSVKPIGLEERRAGFWSILALFLCANVVVTTIFTGMLMVPDLSFTTVISVALAGSLMGVIPVALIGNIGTRTGLPTMILTRGSFGQKGSLLPSAVNTIILIGWSFVQAYMGGLSLDRAVEYLTGYSNINLFVIITEALVVFITIYGHVSIQKTENLIAILMLLLGVIVFAYMFVQFDISKLLTMSTSKHPSVTTMVGFDMVVSTAFSWMTSSCDYTRYCNTQKGGMLGTWFGVTVASVFAMGLGASVAGFALLQGEPRMYDPTDLIGSINPVLGFIAGIVIFLSVLSTNVLALYSATMSYLAIFQKSRFVTPTIIMGIIIVAGSLLKQWLLDNFQNFLLLVGTLFIPVAAIMLIDYYFLKRGKYDAEEIVEGSKKTYWYSAGVNYMAYIAYIIGALFAYYFTYVQTLPTGATIWTFIFTAIVYWGIMKVVKDQTHRQTKDIKEGLGYTGFNKDS